MSRTSPLLLLLLVALATFVVFVDAQSVSVESATNPLVTDNLSSPRCPKGSVCPPHRCEEVARNAKLPPCVALCFASSVTEPYSVVRQQLTQYGTMSSPDFVNVYDAGSGEKIPYSGIRMKSVERPIDTKSAGVNNARAAPGQFQVNEHVTVCLLVDLTTGFDLGAGREYTVAVADAALIASIPLEKSGPYQLVSVPNDYVEMSPTERMKQELSRSSDPTAKTLELESVAVASRMVDLQAVNATTCTAAQTVFVQSAELGAKFYVDNVDLDVNNQSCTSDEYVRWFGVPTQARRDALVTMHADIKTALDASDWIPTCTTSVTCVPGLIAFVLPADATHAVFLCGLFHELSNIPSPTKGGWDTASGTIIHELTHFNDIGGVVVDHVYGHDASRSLAINTPALAILNADNFQFFFEDVPQTANPSVQCDGCGALETEAACMGGCGCGWCNQTAGCHAGDAIGFLDVLVNATCTGTYVFNTSAQATCADVLVASSALGVSVNLFVVVALLAFTSILSLA